jgi:hypothetical protein
MEKQIKAKKFQQIAGVNRRKEALRLWLSPALCEESRDMATKNLTTMRQILVFAAVLVFLCIWNLGETFATEIVKSDFELVVDCQSETPQLCVVGKPKVGTQMTLLQSQPPKACAVKTTARTNQLESSGTSLTALQGSCEVPREFAVAVVKKRIKGYDVLPARQILNTDEVEKIDKAVRDSSALSELLGKAQGTIPGDLKELEGITPKIYQFSLPGVEVSVVSYGEQFIESKGASGPKVAVINGRAYPLAGWCSYRTLNIFRLNGQHYVQSGSCCCNCGITIMELFLITPRGLVGILADDSLSD